MDGRNKQDVLIRNAKPAEYAKIGQLMVEVYSNLNGFLKETEHPGYYRTLRNVADLVKNPGTEIIVGVAFDNSILGAVVYFGDMQYYGSGGIATSVKKSAGFRFLAVSPDARGQGVGRLLTQECINRAKDNNLQQVIIHTTQAMMNAWKMYEKIGFKRAEEFDFIQKDLPVFGFRFEIAG